MRNRREVQRVLDALRRDRALWAVAPCGHEYRLSDSELFHAEEFTPSALEFIAEQNGILDEYKQSVRDLRHKLTLGFTKKSVEVRLGKTVEKISPVLPRFPYRPRDCRVLYEPIDYLAFVGLERGSISQFDFVEMKTGRARLNEVQREIRDVVNENRVRMRKVGL